MSKINEEQIEQLESVANTLVGMSFDPAIPKEVREVLMHNGNELRSITEALLENEDDR